jgi:DNA-binding NtrC family response regulator
MRTKADTSSVRHKILVVEDDAAHRAALERHLGRSGFDVLACDSAEQALSRFSAFTPDLVISDIRMAGLSGMDLLGTLTANSQGTPVVLITAHDDMQMAVDAMRNGAQDFLTKPLDLDVLDEVVEHALAGSCREAAEAAEPAELPTGGGRLIGRERAMVAIYKVVGRVAGTDAPVLIRGETGTGKELVARTIHENSGRKEAPFITVNCAALPEPLLESELFGHLKGSFTGATADRRGRFELADNGTILLDEIGDTSLAFQAKLLRVLQEKEFYPVGGETPRRTNARVLAATHRNIQELTHTGGFRQDLYYRLRVVELHVPPLRQRRGDLPRLAHYLATKAAANLGRPTPVINDAAMGLLLGYDWPGNVRELENAITRAVVLAQGNVLGPEDFDIDSSGRVSVPGMPTELQDGHASLDDMERIYVQQVLVRTGGHKSRTAEILHVSRGRLDRIIEKHGLTVEFG